MPEGKMIISVKAHPGSGRQEVRIGAAGQVEIWLKSRAEKGKANEELLRLLAAHFRCPSSDIRLKSGSGGRLKLIEVKSLTKEGIKRTI